MSRRKSGPLPNCWHVVIRSSARAKLFTRRGPMTLTDAHSAVDAATFLGKHAVLEEDMVQTARHRALIHARRTA